MNVELFKPNGVRNNMLNSQLSHTQLTGSETLNAKVQLSVGELGGEHIISDTIRLE